jgi:hypothetical protein
MRDYTTAFEQANELHPVSTTPPAGESVIRSLWEVSIKPRTGCVMFRHSYVDPCACAPFSTRTNR